LIDQQLIKGYKSNFFQPDSSSLVYKAARPYMLQEINPTFNAQNRFKNTNVQFVDDNGEAYLFWRKKKAARLTTDLRKTAGEIITI